MKQSEIRKELLKFCFLTGSKAFGTATEESDRDLCYSTTHSAKVGEILMGLHRHQSNYFGGFKVYVGGEELNLIPLHPHEFKCWWLATKAYTPIAHWCSSLPKHQRHAIFQGMVQSFKGILHHYSDLEMYTFPNNTILKKENA